MPSGENNMGYASIANDSFELALKRMENIIRKNGYDFVPGAKLLDTVVSPSDNIIAGIIKAFENCGYPKEQLLLIIGTDFSKRTRAYLKENSLYMTVLKNNNELHDAILSIANALKSGKKFDTSRFTMRDTYNRKARVQTLLCGSFVATGDLKSIDILQFKDNFPKAIAKYLPSQIGSYRPASGDNKLEYTKVIFKGK